MSTTFSSLDSTTQAQWSDLQDTLASISAQHPDAVFASSLAAEDMVLTHAIAQARLPIVVFTLETGRLHAETVAMIEKVKQRYSLDLQVIRPDQSAVDVHVAQHGSFAFYDSIELRKACCSIRKVQPLRRVLQGHSAWLTGQHRDQSVTRNGLAESEFDEVFGLQKYNPLARWTSDQVWEVIRAFDIPYNPLHDQGYPSIGCEPCTRAIRPGEDPRAGRWWWEQASSKECGLHEGNAGFTKVQNG